MLALIRQMLFGCDLTASCLTIILRLLTAVSILLISYSAQSQELTVSDDDWVYEEQAIKIKIIASSDLNSVSGRPHSLVIGVFQLSDPNTFHGLSVTREGSVQLLDNGLVDDTIVGHQKIIVRPGEQKIVRLARYLQAKYIGLIAGYFSLNPKLDVKIFVVPLVAQENLNQAKPGKLFLNIKLGNSNTLQILQDHEDGHNQ